MANDIVVVGGGAGGLELACRLGRRLRRRRGSPTVTLVDARLSHIWKPSLHEVAAGTLDIHQEGLSYQMLAHDNGFRFVYGAMTALDCAARTLTVGEVRDEAGEVLVGARPLSYRSLVIAVGSTSNYFGVPGAAEHTISLNATEDAEHFRLRMLKAMARADERKARDPQARVDIVIIGGGATGVELAAELREASGVLAAFPTLDLGSTVLGVWGRKTRMGHILRDGDRVEIYRPLRVDPKVARRERFNQQGARSAGLFARRRAGAKAGY
jgi:NADH dehydrogenase